MAHLTIDAEDGFERYALPLISYFCGFECRADPEGTIKRQGDGVILPRVAQYRRADIPRYPTSADYQSVAERGASFPFDLFAAIRFWLADEGNPPDKVRLDRHDRLLFESSAQASTHQPTRPAVNGYLKLFRAWVSAQFGVTGKSRPARILLSHDVDDPVDPGNLRHPLWLMGATLLAGRPRSAVGQLLSCAKALNSAFQGGRNRHWNFKDIVRLEQSFGATSVFCFASTPWWMAGAATHDVKYDVRDPQFRAIMRWLRAEGAHLAIHNSYNAHSDLALMSRERRRLQRLTGDPIRGGRHHYWRMGTPFWDTLWAHGEVGSEFDMSVGFNEAPGYRLGIGLPFFPWHPVKGRPISVLQVPTLIMDGNLLYDESSSVDDALLKVSELFDELKEAEGTVSVDWHVRTAYPGSKKFTRWADVYRGLLEMVSNDPELSFTTPAELLSERSLASPSAIT